jgi:hypothetical protein
LKYKFNTVKLYNKDKLTMDFDGEYEKLTNIFNEVVLDYDNKHDWLEAIEDSVKGNSQNHDFGVPGFGAEVEKEKTVIYCDFTDEELEITTNQFRKISEIWFDVLEEFKKTGNIKIKEGIIE